MKTKRDNNWLLSRLDYIWLGYFPDIAQTNKVFIKFGRNSRWRLGSIRLDRKTNHTIIIITSMFKDLKIPTEVIDHTIAHELVHYTHGFSSPHSKLHKYPHEGGVVKRELVQRGLDKITRVYQDWIKSYKQSLVLRAKNLLRSRYDDQYKF